MAAVKLTVSFALGQVLLCPPPFGEVVLSDAIFLDKLLITENVLYYILQ